MFKTRSRSLTALAAGALLLAPLAGCGSDDKTDNASSKSSPSASSSPAAPASATPDASAGADDSAGPAAAPGARLTKDNLVATMIAAIREKKTAHMVMELGSSMQADADLRYAGTTTDMKMSMTMGGTKAVVILVDGVMYMQQAGGKYLKIDKNDPAMGNLLQQMSSMGPEASVAAMKGAVQKVEYAGTATVDGDKTSKYHVTVDTSAVSKSLGTSPDATGLPKAVTYDLYVDHDHLMRRIDMTVSGQHIKMLVSDWGKPVDIKAPPAFLVQNR